MNEQQARENAIGFCFFVVVMGILMATTSGCSFGVEFGYHGHTGRDDRTQTQLVRDGDDAQVRRAAKY